MTAPEVNLPGQANTMPRGQLPGAIRVAIERDLTPAEREAVGGGETAANFAFYVPYSSDGTELSWAKAYQGDRLAGVAPVVRLRRRKATDMLRPPLRRWLGPIVGPLARKTTLLVDTAFMAYDDRSPFLTAAAVDRAAVKQAISSALKAQKKVDTVWISEPVGEADWAAGQGYAQFHTLPMVHVDLVGCKSLEDYASRLSKKRRRNFRHERETFASAGATIETHHGPLAGHTELLSALRGCLEQSASHSQFTVPYNDVLTDPRAFAAQRQIALVAMLEGQAIGFMSFIQDGDRLMQCHGGLDYRRSHEVLAYHNLIYAGIAHGVSHGCRLMSMGPLNNETKRRAGGELRPIVACLWNRNPVDQLVARKLFIKNFEVYRGELGAEPQVDAAG
jgi:hypothetical protein